MEATQEKENKRNTKLPKMMQHAMNAGFARGSIEGFTKVTSDNNHKNCAICAAFLELS